MWSQLIANPIAVTLSASLGILSTAAINNSWGLELWNPWDLLGAILNKYWTGGARTLIFLCAFCWMVSILGTNIAANMIPFGSDSTLLFPKYLTIPRGQFIVEFLAFAICPWKILASASIFTTFLAGYGLFMASVVAIMVCDCRLKKASRTRSEWISVADFVPTDWLLTRGNVFVGQLYNPTQYNEHYYYSGGWNIQAYIAYVAGIALPFAGFVGTLGAEVSAPATKLGQLGWCLSFATTFVVYYVLCLVWPTKNQRLIREMGLRREEAQGDEITAADGTLIVEQGSGVYVYEETIEVERKD